MVSMIDEVFLRFPHLGIQFFKNLDDRSLAKSREVAKSWSNFIDYEDMPWKRIQKNWEKTLHKYPCKDGQTKLLVALITGQTKMFEVIFATEKDNLKPYIDLKDVPSGLEKEMRDLMEIPRINLIEPFTLYPYHLAAAIGNLKAFQLMYDSFGNLGWLTYGSTPLHFAAYHGHLDICNFLIEKI